MKKIVFFMLIIITILANVTLASVGIKEAVLHYAGITINIDNNIINPKDANGKIVDPFIIDGTTYLPVRAVSEALGKSVSWDAKNYSVHIIDSGDKRVETSSGEVNKKIYEEKKELNYKDISIYINEKLLEPKDATGKVVEPFIIDGTTYLPVRAVAEAFNKNVEWKDETKTVLISKKEEIKKEENIEEIAKINNVVVKIIDGVLCAEVSSDTKIDTYNCYSITEGKIKAEPYLNMRESSNATADIVTTIPNETAITIKDVIKLGDKDLWYKVTYNDKSGWVSADYVDITNSTRVIIDLGNTSFATNTETKNINYEIIKSIRFGAQENNVSRIVLDLNNTSPYSVVQNDTKTITYLALSDKFEIPTNDSKDVVLVASNDDKLYLPKEDETIKDDIQISGDIDNEDNKTNEDSEKDDNVVISQLADVTSVKYSSSTDKTKIKIEGDYEYNIFTLENPDRIVLDISGAKLNVDGPTEISPNNKNLTKIRFSQNEEDVVRVVFDVNVKSEYIVTQNKTYLMLEVKETEQKNVDYINYETYGTLVLKDTDLNYFKSDHIGNKYYLTYSSNKFKSGKGTLEINDDFVEEIVIKSSKITIYANDNMAFSIKQKGDDVVITIKEKRNQSATNKVILIDAGHGGSDPGACNGSIYEKVYNLKIALKLRDMLEKTDGIEVRMSRDNDVYMNREDRLEFILDNQDADLLVSVHNNSLANKNYQGTMVLFYNKPGEQEEYGITSKEFATLVKNNLIEELETIDRGVVSRDDLWVLTQNNVGEKPQWAISNIPSILCEVIFISNDYEAARLQTDEFQEKTAKAIYDGIIEAISIMD